MSHPWDWNIYIHHQNQPNVYVNIPYMDRMGNILRAFEMVEWEGYG